jgi:hypothetical protein
MSKGESTESTPFILIEVQPVINQDCMIKFISYATGASSCYKTPPLILVLVTK